MSQRSRHDAPRRFHHVANRGAARRVIFPDRHAKRRFLALLACSVRRGELEVEAFCVMTTHFHLLVRGRDGDVYYGLMRVLNAYARYFNRRYKRDGSPFRGRFWSSPVTSHAYWQRLIWYIDQNPVQARLVDHPSEWPYGSARLYARVDGAPLWLSRGRVERYIQAIYARKTYAPRDYMAFASRGASASDIDFIERRLHAPARTEDPTDELLASTPDGVASWMERKAELADGRPAWVAIASRSTVCATVDRLRESVGELAVQRGRVRRDGWVLLEAGLLHAVAGLSLEEVAVVTGCVRSTAGLRARHHFEAMAACSTYRVIAGRAAREALAETYGRVVVMPTT